ncbi:MAG: PDZ domain-containing protein [Terrimonas sp.]|nr:PDZ domain-containing protein [Terrimonas sp.]
MGKKITGIFSLFIWGLTYGQQPQLLRQPAVNPDGTQLAFSYQGDIWTVPVTGGNATRLTIHEAYESNPVYSPDGRQIAFSADRYGNNDVFVIPSTGGLAKRLTFHASGDQVSSWTEPDKIVFSTNREFRQLERPNEVYAISPTGGTESRVLDAMGFDPVYSPNGRFMAFVRGDINPVARLAYDGSANRDLWLFDTQKKSYTKLPGFKTNDISPQWAGNGLLYFLSSIDGAYNLYRLPIDENGKAGTPQKLTNFKDESIRAYGLSYNGKMIVLEKDMNLYAMNTESGAIKKININTASDERWDPEETKSFTSGAEDYALSPNGKKIAFSIRGEIFVRESDKDKPRCVNISNHPYRDIEPAWLNDSTLLFTSDRMDGNFDLYLVRSADTAEHDIFKTLKLETVRLTRTPGDENSLSISNDGKKIAYVRGRGTFVVANISETGKLSGEKILNDSWASPSGISWSPDDQWLAYSIEDLYFNEEVFIRRADNTGIPVNVSMHPRQDRNPVWSKDGSKLGFISDRSVGRSNDIWFVWLRKEDWEKDPQDWLYADDQVADPKSNGKKTVQPLVIDTDKLFERIVQVTSFPGDEANLAISNDGETFYYTTPNSSALGRDLYSIKWDGKNLRELTKGGSNPSGVAMDREGKYLYYTRSGSFSRLDAKSGVTESLPYQAKLHIDFITERTQVFEEAWRTLRDGFYDPHFHGQDWGHLHDKYKDRCIYASTSEDFRDMFNLMLGELNSSHQGFIAASRVSTQKVTTGYIGAELFPEKNGMRVNRVIPGTPADKEFSKLYAGEIITNVNENKVSGSNNFYEYLEGKVNEKVVLKVIGKDGREREVVLRLSGSINNEIYQEWVDDRKKMVEQWSGGKLGYIHIQAMNFPSFEVVEREFAAAGYGKDGLVIDVRYNGGGSTTDYLMTVLNYKQHAYTIPRGASDNPEKDKKKFREYYPLGERLVYSAWTKPSIALCNEGSYSNAEIFSHAYKTLGIGKLVGVPTNGSVISTGGKLLMDGSFVRLPFRGWFTKATDKNQELGPAIPDIIVENQPNWLAAGTDDQLKAAVDELMKEMKNK